MGYSPDCHQPRLNVLRWLLQSLHDIPIELPLRPTEYALALSTLL